RLLAVDAQLAADIQAVHAGQHEVEHDDIVTVGHGQVQSGHPVRGVIDAVAAAFEELADHLGNPAVVLDQKDQAGLLVTLFHGSALAGRSSQRCLHLCEGCLWRSDKCVKTGEAVICKRQRRIPRQASARPNTASVQPDAAGAGTAGGSAGGTAATTPSKAPMSVAAP